MTAMDPLEWEGVAVEADSDQPWGGDDTQAGPEVLVDAEEAQDDQVDLAAPQPEHVVDLPNFDPDSTTDVLGDPAADAHAWHLQESDDTCAVAAQEFVLENLTGVSHDEASLVALAEDNGWYRPGGGTAMGDVGRVLEAFGVEVTRTHGASYADLEAALGQGRGVIVGVDAEEIWTPGVEFADDTAVGDTGGIPGQDANHAVQVIGIDRGDPDNPQVILNDPGHPDGRAVLVPADEFIGAWQDSGQFVVFAGAPAGMAA